MKPHQLAALTLDELNELKLEIDDAIKSRAFQELVFAEKRVNELREMVGLKKRPMSKPPEPRKKRRKLMEIAAE